MWAVTKIARFRGYEDPIIWGVNNIPVNFHATTINRYEPTKNAQQRGFASTIRARDRDTLSRLHLKVYVELERAKFLFYLRVNAHDADLVCAEVTPLNQRSRNPTNTANESATSSKASTIAFSGLTSRA